MYYIGASVTSVTSNHLRFTGRETEYGATGRRVGVASGKWSTLWLCDSSWRRGFGSTHLPIGPHELCPVHRLTPCTTGSTGLWSYWVVASSLPSQWTNDPCRCWNNWPSQLPIGNAAAAQNTTLPTTAPHIPRVQFTEIKLGYGPTSLSGNKNRQREQLLCNSYQSMTLIYPM